MKVAFISDIHGNAVALEAVLADIATKNIDQIAVLGDICFRGPEPKRALKLVQSLKTNVIKGNADEWVVRGINEGEVPDKALNMMRKERDWTIDKLSEEDVEYLQNLPTDLSVKLTNNLSIYGFHATPDSLFEVVTPIEDVETLESKFMIKKDADIYVYGHIHLPYIRFFKGKCVANLGSVGLPFDGQSKASYLIVEGEGDQFNITINRVSYDFEKVIQQYREFDYPNVDFMTKIIRTASL